jgi:hypothetical protein
VTTTTAASTPPAAEKKATHTPSPKVPKNHTVNKDGAMHAPGLDNPTQRCAACHGKELKGGKIGPSCFKCHETAKW